MFSFAEKIFAFFLYYRHELKHLSLNLMKYEKALLLMTILHEMKKHGRRNEPRVKVTSHESLVSKLKKKLTTKSISSKTINYYEKNCESIPIVENKWNTT